MAKLLPWKKRSSAESLAVAERESSRPMVEVALPTPGEPSFSPLEGASLSEDEVTASSLTGSEPIPLQSGRGEEQATRVALIEALRPLVPPDEPAGVPTPLPDKAETPLPNKAHLNIFTDAPLNPGRRQVVELVRRAADEIPSEVEKVLRYWLQAADTR
jgi:hypothetical protein